MKIRIEKKYLVLPIGKNATSKNLCFYRECDGQKKMVMDFSVRLDMLTPNFTAYLDVSRFMGEELECETVPQMSFALSQSDTRQCESSYDEEYRPYVHFSAKNGWTNDPNGMIKYDGVYHLFYQYNPLGMDHTFGVHWGHATSRDMFHWEEKEPALYPDDMGLPYSGGAIEDKNNVSGLKTGDKNPMLLYYTASTRSLLSGGGLWSQCLAYSNDGGITFEKYAGNPLFINDVAPMTLGYDERDPKVVWVEELGKYVMLLFIKNPNIYRFLSSDDLLHWTPLQEDFDLLDDRECPDIFPYTVDGERVWVIMGANDKYLVGSFKSGRFEPLSESKPLSYSQNKASYAAHAFSGMDGGRVVKMYWDWINIPSDHIVNQMSIPVELVLHKEQGEYYLTAEPVREIESIYEKSEAMDGVLIDAPLNIPLERGAYDIKLELERGTDVTIDIFGHTLKISDKKNMILYNSKTFLPLREGAEKVDVRIIVDRCSFEIYADGGRASMTLPLICDYNLPYIEISAKIPVRLGRICCNKLLPICK